MVRIRLSKEAAIFFVVVSTLLQIHPVDVLKYKVGCKSAICQALGKEISDSIDEEIDPCDDFYQHACGKWIARNVPSDFRPLFNQQSIITSKVNQQLRDLLEENSADDTEAIRKAKDFFKVCMNQDAIDENRSKNLQAIFNDNGGWPLLAEPVGFFDRQKRLTWQEIHENIMNATEYSGLFQISVDVNMLNRTNHVIAVDDIESLQQLELLELTYMVDKFLESMNFTKAASSDDILSIHKFIGDQREASSRDVTSDFDSEYHLTTIEELQSIWNTAVKNNPLYQINWLHTIRRRFHGMDFVIDATETIALRPRGYVRRLGELLSETPIRTIVNYIHWYNVYHVARSLDITKDVEVQGKPERWCACCEYHEMKDAVSLMWVKKYFAGAKARRTRASISEIFDQLRNTVREKIDRYALLNDETRELFRDKLDGMAIETGYPEWYDVPGEMDKYYDKLAFGSDHLQNILAANRFYSRKELLMLRLPARASRDDWPISPTDVPGIMYYDAWNIIRVPAAELQIPLFDHRLPAGQRFGLIASVIGHEVFHAFDLRSLNRDNNGILRPWLETLALTKYLNKTECIVNQFNQFPISKNPYTDEITHIDGEYTLVENIADNPGIRSGYEAYQQYKRSHHIKPDDKLFFYGFAHFFCESWQSEYPSSDVHAPSHARVNLALSNLPGFSDAFACSPGATMNPPQKCILWD